MTRLTVIFSGRVQGVGFRATVVDCAAGRAVTGFVRNLDDGRVEAVLEGDAAEIRRVLAAVNERMIRNLEGIERHAGQATGEFEDFRIRR